jgi:hypothetical protein
LVLSAASCPAPSSVPAPKSCHYGPQNTPDPNCTPGDSDTDDLEIICRTSTKERRCKPGKPLHLAILEAYDVTIAGEIDHLISLELGGSNDAKNLWPQPSPDYKAKDELENYLHKRVCLCYGLADQSGPECAGKLDLQTARKMVIDFTHNLQLVIPPAK